MVVVVVAAVTATLSSSNYFTLAFTLCVLELKTGLSFLAFKQALRCLPILSGLNFLPQPSHCLRSASPGVSEVDSML
jgi:hypothetical protein